jgi:4-amino-4-deoxy-L-arabinose transferase-like glycosyltransferase
MPNPKLATDATQTDRWLLIAVTLFAVLVRAPVASRNTRALRADVDNYREFALNLREQGTFGPDGGQPSAYRPVLYPLLLAALINDDYLNPAAVVSLHVGLGLATVWLAALIGGYWHLGRWRFAAGVLVACDPILLKQSTVVMSETLATFLAALALLAATLLVERQSLLRALAAGISLGLAVLCRPTFAVWALMTVPALVWLLPRKPRRLSMVAAVILATSITLAPWIVRNWIVFGRPIITTTHGGHTLALANNPQFYEHLRTAPGQPWEAEEFNQTALSLRFGHTSAAELEDNRQGYELAWRAINGEPWSFLRACLYRESRLWGVLPLGLPGQGASEARGRDAVAAFYALEFFLALVGIYTLGRKLLTTPWLFGLLLAASFTLVHALYWTDMRMRAPVMPAVALAAAFGAARLATFVEASFSRRK